MSTMHLEPMTEDEMYAIEFHDCELHEDEPEEEAENEYHCPVCHATELQYAMHYRVSDDDETQELYRCARCGATRPKSYTGAPAAVRLAKRTTAGWSLSCAAGIQADSRVGGQHLRTPVPDSRAWRPPSCPEWRPHGRVPCGTLPSIWTSRQSGCGDGEPEEELEVEPQRAEGDELGEEEIEPEPPEEAQGEQNDEWNSAIQHQLPSRSSPALGRWQTRRRTLWRTDHVLARRRSGDVRAAGGGTADSRTRDPGARDLRDLQG